MYHSISHILSPSSHLMTSHRTGNAFPLTTPGVKLLLASHRRPLSLPYPHAGGRAPPQRCYLAAAAKVRLARSLRSHLSGTAGCRAYSICLRARPYAHTPCRRIPSSSLCPPQQSRPDASSACRSSHGRAPSILRLRRPPCAPPPHAQQPRVACLSYPHPISPGPARRKESAPWGQLGIERSAGDLATSSDDSLSPFLSPTWLRYRECYRPVAGAR